MGRELEKLEHQRQEDEEKAGTVVRKLASRGKLSLLRLPHLCLPLIRPFPFPAASWSPFVSNPSLHTGLPLFRLFPLCRGDKGMEERGQPLTPSHCLLSLELFGISSAADDFFFLDKQKRLNRTWACYDVEMDSVNWGNISLKESLHRVEVDQTDP